MPRYRFHLSDGRIAETEKSPDELYDVHPDAVITHEVLLDDRGHFVGMTPYRGPQPAELDSLDARTMPELRDEIERRGLERPPSNARKADLIAILAEAPPAADETAESEDAENGGESG